MEFEQVAIVDVDNGARLETYTIAGPRGSGVVCLNGAAARLVSPGDKVILISYADYEQAERAHYERRVVHVDTKNNQSDEITAEPLAEQTDQKSVGEGKRVSESVALGGRRSVNTKKRKRQQIH